MKNSVAPAWTAPAPARIAVEKFTHGKSDGDISFGEAVRTAHAGKSGQDRTANVPTASIESAWTNIELKFTTITERVAGPKDVSAGEDKLLPLEDESPAEPDMDEPVAVAPAFVAVAAVQLRAPLAAAMSRHDVGRASLGRVANAEMSAEDASTAEKPVSASGADIQEPAAPTNPAVKAVARQAVAPTPGPASAVSPDVYNATQQDESAKTGGRETVPDRPNRPVEATPKETVVLPRVAIVAEQNHPAPAPPQAAPATSIVIDAIAGETSWRNVAAATDLPALSQASAASSAQMLKIQLHPAELGMVTANLRFVGEQLTVELQVESLEAQKQLSAETDSIVKALRALGLEVDQVTVRQSTMPPQDLGRIDDASPPPGSTSRDQQSFNAQNSGGRGGESGSRTAGRDSGNGAQDSQSTNTSVPAGAGGGLYI